MKTSHYILVLFATFCSVVSACSPSETKWVNHAARIINVEPTNAVVKHSVGGTAKITSGCTFSVRNMTIVPSGNGVYWWGIPVANNTVENYPRVVMAGLGSFNGQTISFTLDPQYSFDDIAIMEIRSEGDNRAYGAWAISGNVSAYYGTTNGATLGIDPEDISNSASSLPLHSVMCYLIVVLVTLFYM